MLVATDLLEMAATDVAQIGSTVSAGNLAAAIPTTALTAAAVQAAAFHAQFVSTLTASSASCAGTEAAIVTSLEGVGGAINTVVSNGFQTIVYGPVHTVGQTWISSSLGQALDPIINGPPMRCSGAI
jgi:PE family